MNDPMVKAAAILGAAIVLATLVWSGLNPVSRCIQEMRANGNTLPAYICVTGQ
jgi:hypothetical protein